MGKYTVYLEEGLKSEILIDTDNYNEADDLLNTKWPVIEGRQILTLLGECGLTVTRKAVKGAPLTKWEETRLNFLKINREDIARHGDVTLIARGLLEKFDKGRFEYVKIV